ncbi:MAG TPA: DUF892 family protein [Solirubrobacteraceae bacterium]|nr:DUF892 family protein [Solirubrobacteraceae bacterium]
MHSSEEKIVQYLEEAHAAERGLTRDLQAQIMMTPRGAYRDALEAHLRETREHAGRVQTRIQELGRHRDPLAMLVGVAESAAGQALALGKAPLNVLRGGGGEEKVLKNAKDAAAAEALEIATYTALEQLAARAGDEDTEKLAVAIRREEERMLERILREIPKLTDAVLRAEVKGDSTYDLGEIGAADAVRDAGTTAKRAARKAGARARRTARNARRVPGVASAEGQLKGAVASADDLAIADYEQLTASEIVERLPGLSQIELAKIDSYERRHQDRATVLGKLGSLRADEPWPGYDELTVEQVREVLDRGDDEGLAKEVLAYERAHKDRAGVVADAERELARA